MTTSSVPPFLSSISGTNFSVSSISFPSSDHCNLPLFALPAADPPSLAAFPHGTRSPPPPRTSPLPLSPSCSPAGVRPPPLPLCSSIWPRVVHASWQCWRQGRGRKHCSEKEKSPCVPPARSASLTLEPAYRKWRGMSRGLPPAAKPPLCRAACLGGSRFSTAGAGKWLVTPAHLVLV